MSNPENIALLSSLNLPSNPLIIELGSWMGGSANVLCDAHPDATVVCVDTWEGSVEHRGNPFFEPFLENLQDAFFHAVWPHRERVIAIRDLSWNGLQMVHDAGVKADMVYVDASHQRKDVLKDLETARRLFPGAIIIGDDWHWPGVVYAVTTFCRRHNLHVVHGEKTYQIVQGPTKAAEIRNLRRRAALRYLRGLPQRLDERYIWPVVRKLRRLN